MAEETKKSKVLPTYTHHESYSYFLMPQGFPVENFRNGLKYKAKPDDLFVATYPKCGTTWMQHICYLILNNGKALPYDQELTKVFPHLEEMGAEYINDSSNFMPLAYLRDIPKDPNDNDIDDEKFKKRLIKTHLYFEMTPVHPEAKYVYVARNPKDCVVSFYHHTRGFEKHYNFAEGSFDDFFDLFMEGGVDFGDYFHSLKSWLPYAKGPNVYFTTYEDMKQNPRETILNVAEFLGGSSLRNNLLSNNEEILNNVLEQSSFGSMQKGLSRWSSARPADIPFVRKGTVGDWQGMLSKEQSERMNQKMKEVFTEEELDFIWSDYDAIMGIES